MLGASDVTFCAQGLDTEYSTLSSLDLDGPAFLRADAPRFSRELGAQSPSLAPESRPISPHEFVEKLNAHFSEIFLHSPCPATLLELGNLDLPGEIVESLRRIRDVGWSEDIIVICFLYAFAQRVHKGLLSRNAARAIAHAAKRSVLPTALLDDLALYMQNLTGDEWNWDKPLASKPEPNCPE